MNLEGRISNLEDRVGITDQTPPLIRIDVMDCQRGSTDEGTAQMAIIPGKVRGPSGFTLFRKESENPDSFLERCEKKHSEFYI